MIGRYSYQRKAPNRKLLIESLHRGTLDADGTVFEVKYKKKPILYAFLSDLNPTAYFKVTMADQQVERITVIGESMMQHFTTIPDHKMLIAER